MAWITASGGVTSSANVPSASGGTVGVSITFGLSSPTTEYRWAIERAPAGSSATLTGPRNTTCSLTPDVVGEYTISFWQLQSNPIYFTVVVSVAAASSAIDVQTADTSNATETQAASWAIPRSKTNVYDITITGLKSGEVAQWRYLVSVVSDANGALTVNAPALLSSVGSFGSVRFDGATADTLKCLVTGVVATSIQWMVSRLVVGTR